MDARTVKTKIWEDDWFQSLSDDAQRLFFFLITNSRIGFTGIYEISDFVINNATRLKGDKLQKIKAELSPKVIFFKEWVYVKNSSKHNTFKGASSDKAADKELDKIPQEVREYFINNKIIPPLEAEATDGSPSVNPSPSTSSSISNINNNNINIENEKKSEKIDVATYLKNPPMEDIAEFISLFNVTERQIRSKGEDLWYWFTGLSAARKRSYSKGKSILRNAIKKDFGERSELDQDKKDNPDLIKLLMENSDRRE